MKQPLWKKAGDGPGEDEDFGLEQVTGNTDDRYMFRTSPLRNLALQTTLLLMGAIWGTPMTCRLKSLSISFEGPDTA